jgi:protein tyrosine/serine phosphatase
MDNRARRILFRRPESALIVFLFILALVAPANAQSDQSDESGRIKIKNFGRMDDRFYRGAQPDKSDYKDIASLGVRIVIDLTDDPEDYARRATESAGMRYINIPMSDRRRPLDEQIEEFLRVVNDPENTKFFVHCEGGRHRTGLMGAVYRMNFYGWNFKQAYREMKNYDFYTRWGHGAIKEYAQDYFDRLQTRGISVSTGEVNK